MCIPTTNTLVPFVSIASVKEAQLGITAQKENNEL
jgi:hypothetical protein